MIYTFLYIHFHLVYTLPFSVYSNLCIAEGRLLFRKFTGDSR